ncbi:helix-turn-helix transcriptional regulator [Gordonia alkaliphila]|uniref:HTH cro/C1-type domain-containing protein n=1 Tax=Gordonia alkaliphila TaxID=1053547 RepID=A0ABP8Z4W9_9ACTN
MDEDERFRLTVKRLREQLGWSQAQLAEKLREQGFSQFHPTTVSRVEKGDRAVRLAEARGFAKAFDRTVGEMMLDEASGAYHDRLSRDLDDLWVERQAIRAAAGRAQGHRTSAQYLIRKFDQQELDFRLKDLPVDIQTGLLNLILRAKNETTGRAFIEDQVLYFDDDETEAEHDSAP